MATNYTIDGRKLATVGDPQRQWLWELVIPNVALIAPDTFTESEDFIVRIRSAGIPSMGIEPMESNFMAMKQFFMGKPTFETNITTMMEEFEDQKVMKFLYAWRQRMFNIGPIGGVSVTQPVNPIAGASLLPTKRSGLATTMYLNMYGYDGRDLEYKIQFINAWPESVAQVSLDYTSNESIKYSVNWKFDYWKLIKSV